MDRAYVETVRLLLETAPVLFRTPLFIMKGGTAINLFIQEMPRLSVDIDVVYDDHRASRADALAGISEALLLTREQLEHRGLKVRIAANDRSEESKLFVQGRRSQVKIEVNHVFRGTLLPKQQMRLVKKARDLFTLDLSVPVLATAELYGSKLVAALDRQHPRDLFDVIGMYEKSGLSPEIVECFVGYLAGHNRPVHEVLFSRNLDLTSTFENDFVGMTTAPVDLADLLTVRDRLRDDLFSKLTKAHREFLLGLVQGEPDWRLMTCSHLSELPAIRWKLSNLAKLKKSNPAKFARQAEELGARFE